MSLLELRKFFKRIPKYLKTLESGSLNSLRVYNSSPKRPIPIDYSPGKYHNLERIYQSLNERMFKGELNLRIGWFGYERSGNARRVVLGSYHEEEQLIRIHRSLDHENIPLFFIEYVVYHEMIHSIVPREYSPSGRTIFHGRKFKEYEKRFPLYKSAVAWEKANIHVLLQGNKSRLDREYGRT